MGGYGTWTLGAHHADVFGGAAAYAGAPSPDLRTPTRREGRSAIEEGVLPAYFALPLHVYQSLDDKNVPPGGERLRDRGAEGAARSASRAAGTRRLRGQVDGRGHAAPAEGYRPSLEWVVARPAERAAHAFLWQPVLPWKRHFYWLRWDSPDCRAVWRA